MRTALQLTVVAVALLITPMGCADEGDPAPEPPAEASSTVTTPKLGAAGDDLSSSSAAEPVAAYQAWLAALEQRDAAAACARHAPQLTIDLRLEAIVLERARLGDPCIDFVAVLWEQPEREFEPLGIEATQVTDEDALLAVDFSGSDQTVRMIRQNTRWLVAEAKPRTDPASAPSQGTAANGPERWLDAWCDLELEMTPAELSALMGPASGTYTISNGGEPQLYWTQDQYDFRAYLDIDPPTGRAIDLVGDYDRLSGAERAGLSCPELR